MTAINSNKKNVVVYSMIILGGVMIALGLAPAPHVMPPPIVTGLGFWILAWGIK